MMWDVLLVQFNLATTLNKILHHLAKMLNIFSNNMSREGHNAINQRKIIGAEEGIIPMAAIGKYFSSL